MFPAPCSPYSGHTFNGLWLASTLSKAASSRLFPHVFCPSCRLRLPLGVATISCGKLSGPHNLTYSGGPGQRLFCHFFDTFFLDRFAMSDLTNAKMIHAKSPPMLPSQTPPIAPVDFCLSCRTLPSQAETRREVIHIRCPHGWKEIAAPAKV